MWGEQRPGAHRSHEEQQAHHDHRDLGIAGSGDRCLDHVSGRRRHLAPRGRGWSYDVDPVT